MTTDERIEQAMDRLTAIWALLMVVGTITVGINYPLWTVIPFIVVGIVGYFAAALALGLYIGTQLAREGPSEADAEQSLERFTEGLRRGDDTNTPEMRALAAQAGLFVAEVVAASDETVGRFMDGDIHDWIDVSQPSGAVERFFFDSVAPHDRAGNPLFIQDSADYAHLNGILYKRST